MLTPDHFNGDLLEEYTPGKWRPAEPYPTIIRWRIRDAWEVICGRAHAVRWPTHPEDPTGDETDE